MRPPIHHRREWKRALQIATPILVFVILIDLFAHNVLLVSEFLLHAIEVIEFGLMMFLLVDILLNLNEAKNRYSFIKRNILRIIMVLPFALVFRALWIIELEHLISPVIFGEWMAGFSTFQKAMKLEKGLDIFDRIQNLVSRS
jgi:hypothetical protein